ncbi:helix-turn-helix domain-containing protein [Kangiella shandongensis]|uniref:helix-turn-helix domain-containing protein n=1 Tax=Kangiella shandongensis TaxID=2763258 RepID=UPI001CBFD69A|nr:AraC family transcriptional regulator [Kangiella shandongensis]
MGKYYREFRDNTSFNLINIASIHYFNGGRVESKDFKSKDMTFLIPLEHAGFELRWEQTDGTSEGKRLAAGDICFIPMNSFYSIEWCNAHFLKLSIKFDFVADAADVSVDTLRHFINPNIGFHDNFMFSTAQVCRKYIESHDDVDEQYIKSWLYVLVNYYFDTYVIGDTVTKAKNKLDSIESIPNSEIRSLIAYIDLNLNKNLTVQDMADYVGMSQYHFIRVFKEMVGMPPARFFGLQKVTKAKEMLLQGIPIVEIAYVLGYSSQSHFSKAFSSIVGLSPREFTRKEGKI